MNQRILQSAVQEVLILMPLKPFLCLPMSVMLHIRLKDNNIESKVATGDLSYNNQIIFKQDFSIKENLNDAPQEWRGHAWVEISDFILDLSIFRTVYSPEFTKPCKEKLIKSFGLGRGLLAASQVEMQNLGFTYKAVDYLSDDMITGVFVGVQHMFANKRSEKAVT
jgi:hypothetical protein